MGMASARSGASAITESSVAAPQAATTPLQVVFSVAIVHISVAGFWTQFEEINWW
jgi:hypothetical protein